MTEKNSDVEWLRRVCGNQSWDLGLPIERARRLLAHIDQLESEVSKQKSLANHESRMVESLEDEVARVKGERRPTIHEIAAQMMAARVGGNIQRDEDSSDGWNTIFARHADLAYNAAEALVEEGRRRDGQA